MNRRQLLRHMREDVFTRLGRSEISGVGVFAIKDIPKGTNPFRGDQVKYNLIRIHASKIRKLPEAIRNYVHDMCVCEDGFYWVPDNGVESITKGWYLNHSKTPNMMTENGDDFITMRDIKVGEELTIDYGTYNDEEDWR